MCSIIHWNCRGLFSNLEDLRSLLTKYSPTCVLLQETMIGNYQLFPPTGYEVYTSSAAGRPVPGDGLAVLIRNGHQRLEIALQTELQAQAFRMRLTKQYTVCNLYLHPNEGVDADQILDLLSQLPAPFIVGGDFNAKHHLWGNADANRLGRVMEQVLLRSDAVLLNDGTRTHFHVQNNTSSAIDLTLCSPDILQDVEWGVHDDLCGSDHYPIIIKERIFQQPRREARFQIDRANWILFHCLTEITDLDQFDGRINVEDVLARFVELLLRAAEASIPINSGEARKPRVPWWNSDCSEACRERKHALRRYQRSGLVADRITYNRARARAKYVQRMARKKSWKDYVSSLNEKTPMTKIWKRIKKMKGKNTSDSTPYLMRGDAMITDPEEVAEMLADHYSNISSSESYSQDFLRLKARAERTPIEFNEENNADYNVPMSLLELKIALKSCRNTAPGNDRIHYQMLKHLHISACELLVSIFNRLWTEGSYPRSWREAEILSFHKPGKPPGHETSYRPISLTSCLGKLMEKIINNRLNIYLENHELLPPMQFGFRKMHSTTDSLIRLTSDINTALNSGDTVIAVFFDMHKAYDTTWRYGILRELHNLGIRGHLGIFIKNFLSLRLFKTRICGSHSEEHIQDEGVPQGSVLSCTLFSVAINKILSTLPAGVKGSLYVDDFMIYTAGRYFPRMQRQLQLAINAASTWALEHGFKFSVEKTNCIHFSRKKGLPQEPILKLNNKNIPHRESVRFLGMILDRRLNWRSHIVDLKAQTLRNLDLLKHLSHTDWGADRAILMRLYNAVIRSKLDYGCLVYQSASPSELSRLDPVHHSALRLATGAFRSSPVMSLYAESGQMSLDDRRDQLAMQYYARSSQPIRSVIKEYINQPMPDINNRRNTPLTYGQHCSLLLQQLNMIDLNILEYEYPIFSSWKLSPETFCDGFSCPSRTESRTRLIRMLFLEHRMESHRHEEAIYTDGSRSEEGAGCATLYGNTVIRRHLRDESSVFTAELIAIEEALNIVSSRNLSNVVIFTDSKSSIEAMMNFNSVHPIISQLIFSLVTMQSQGKNIRMCWIPAHVGVQENERVDGEAKVATSRNIEIIHNPRIPYRDFYPIIKEKVWHRWRVKWEAVQSNKLRTIKADPSPWQSSNCENRRESRILTRLRIGHTLLTHGHLMERRQPPYCDDCIVPLTVLHILAECPSHSEQRLRLFPNTRGLNPEDTLREILAEKPNISFNLDNVIKFTKLCNIYDEI